MSAEDFEELGTRGIQSAVGRGMKMTKVGCWCAAGLAALALAGCGGGAGETLTIGMELNYPPFEMVDDRGRPAGIGVEMARALADDLDRELKVENIPFDGLIPALRTGRVDLVISSMTATDERRETIDFSAPYVSTGLAILVPAGSGVEGVDDLKGGKRIVVKLGTTGEVYARQHLPEATVVSLDQESACVLEVSQGKADAFIYDQLSIFNYQQKNPETTRALLSPLQHEKWAVGVRKGDDALREQVNAFIAEFRARGGFDELAERFLQEEKAMLEAEGIPFIFEAVEER
ncbi:transporter substrate-binding domain-containing protein [soil metagenome]